MMGDKPAVLLAYGVVGLTLAAILPTLGRRRLFESSEGLAGPYKEPLWISLILGMLVVIVLAKGHHYFPWRYVLYGAILGMVGMALSKQDLVRTLPAVLLGLLITAVMPWWLRTDDQLHLSLSGRQSILMLITTAVSYWMLTRSGTGSDDTPLRRQARMLVYIGFGLGLVYLVLSTGLSLTSANTTPWHHWGAYIGPAQLVLAGALPLHDIPVQYGLGPTLMLAQGCQANCWTALYWISGLSTLLMTALLGYLALQFNRSKHPLSVLATLSIVLACCLLWTAYPPSLMASLATPSTSGIRFLPGVLVLALLVRHTRQTECTKPAPAWGHLAWLACILWSPEAGVHATVLWAPYYVWTRTHGAQTGGARLRFMRSAIDLVLVLIGGLGLSTLIYRALLGEWPLPSQYVAYLAHPPGPLPINPYGTIWFALSCMLCWFLGWSLTRRDALNTAMARASWLVALLCFATFTYYLGRSHDNNILNLLPYLGLLLFSVRGLTEVGAMRTLATTLLASLLGWATVFGGINFREAQTQGRLLAFTPQELAQSFNRETQRGLFYLKPQAHDLKLHPEDAIPALKYIRATFQEPVEIFDLFMLVDGGEPYPPWNALHGPENFVFMPSKDRRLYLSRVAKRLNRAGWVLYEKNTDMSDYLKEYDSVYDRTQELKFGTYTAVRFTPKK